MEFNIQIGIKHKIEKIISQVDTAIKYGSGMVEVFATPAMISLMEKTALESVLSFLPKGFNTVGTAVDINHIKATPVGQKVICESELIEIDKKKLIFKIIARDEKGKIGFGTHTRFIININDFMNKI